MEKANKKWPNICFECGERFEGRDTLNIHLVAEHGYMQEGKQLFKPQFCSVCGAKAFYRVANRRYCTAHRLDAIAHLKSAIAKIYEPADKVFEEEWNRIDKIRRARDRQTLHSGLRGGPRHDSIHSILSPRTAGQHQGFRSQGPRRGHI
jgi:hypothetical protein